MSQRKHSAASSTPPEPFKDRLEAFKRALANQEAAIRDLSARKQTTRGVNEYGSLILSVQKETEREYRQQLQRETNPSIPPSWLSTSDVDYLTSLLDEVHTRAKADAAERYQPRFEEVEDSVHSDIQKLKDSALANASATMKQILTRAHESHEQHALEHLEKEVQELEAQKTALQQEVDLLTSSLQRSAKEEYVLDLERTLTSENRERNRERASRDAPSNRDQSSDSQGSKTIRVASEQEHSSLQRAIRMIEEAWQHPDEYSNREKQQSELKDLQTKAQLILDQSSEAARSTMYWWLLDQQRNAVPSVEVEGLYVREIGRVLGNAHIEKLKLEYAEAMKELDVLEGETNRYSGLKQRTRLAAMRENVARMKQEIQHHEAVLELQYGED